MLSQAAGSSMLELEHAKVWFEYWTGTFPKDTQLLATAP